MLIAALLIITQNWKQLRNLPMKGWMNELWYIHPMGYNNKKEWTVAAHSNMDESQKHYAEWKKLDTNDIYGLFPFIWSCQTGKTNL